MEDNMTDIAEMCKRDFDNACATVGSVKDLFSRFSHVIPNQSTEDMLQSLAALGIAIRDALTDICDPMKKYPHPSPAEVVRQI